jgi:hypothetical protein
LLAELGMALPLIQGAGVVDFHAAQLRTALAEEVATALMELADNNFFAMNSKAEMFELSASGVSLARKLHCVRHALSPNELAHHLGRVLRIPSVLLVLLSIAYIFFQLGAYLFFSQRELAIRDAFNVLASL